MISIASIILTILVFSLLIIVHELGHFTTAKLSGVTVNEFWLGMGPTIIKKHYKGTDYCLKALPFGGAVVMEGEDSESDKVGSFSKAKILNKAMIMFAGSFMNFVLGFIIVFIILIPVNEAKRPILADFADGFKYQSENQFMIGDEILSIDGYSIYLAEQDVSYALSINESQVYDIEVLRDGKKVMLEDFLFKPDTFVENGKEVFRYGLSFEEYEPNFMDKIHNTLLTCSNYVRMVYMGLSDLLSGSVSINQLSGPVAITVMIGDAADISMSAMWGFVAFISINLGVMNLLPLPALDGGRLVFLAIEAVRGKPLDPKIEGTIHGVGLMLFLGLMLYVTFHDIFFKILG